MQVDLNRSFKIQVIVLYGYFRSFSPYKLSNSQGNTAACIWPSRTKSFTIPLGFFLHFVMTSDYSLCRWLAQKNGPQNIPMEQDDTIFIALEKLLRHWAYVLWERVHWALLCRRNFDAKICVVKLLSTFLAHNISWFEYTVSKKCGHILLLSIQIIDFLKLKTSTKEFLLSAMISSEEFLSIEWCLFHSHA